MGRAPRTKSVAVGVKMRFPLRRYDLRDSLRTKRSNTVGMPKGRVFIRLAMFTRMTGCGQYLSASSCALISSQWSRRYCNSSTVMPSMPGAPLFRRTCLMHAQIGPIQHVGQQRWVESTGCPDNPATSSSLRIIRSLLAQVVRCIPVSLRQSSLSFIVRPSAGRRLLCPLLTSPFVRLGLRLPSWRGFTLAPTVRQIYLRLHRRRI